MLLPMNKEAEEKLAQIEDARFKIKSMNYYHLILDNTLIEQLRIANQN